MRVLLIDVNCKKSSTGKIVYDLYQRLRADGHEAAICYGRGDLVEGDQIFKFGIDLETNIHAGLARLVGLNGYFSPLSTKRLLKFIDKFNPDVVHIHELHAYFVNHKPLLRYLKKKNIKVVWTFHCEYMYTGKCGHAYDCERWKSECGHCPAIREYPKSLFLDFTKKMFRDKKRLLGDMEFTIATPSEWLAERVKLSFLKDKEIVVVRNGIETNEIFYPRTQGEISLLKEKYGLVDKKIVLAVAPDIMSESKGGQIVLEVSRRFDGENVHFVLVGADADEEIGDHTTLLKRTADQNELAIWYSAADVFLICSKRENFPTTCLEALCCGTPVVGVDAGGTKETAPAPFGTFCLPGDLDGLEKAIRDGLAIDKPSDEIREMGCRLYDKKVMYQSYLELYQGKDGTCEV